MIGEALGNYRLVAKLGSGSMGVVFLAEHQRIVRRVAIKLLAPELVRNQRVLQRFFIEARATSLIRHPGIVDVFDCDVDASGRAYIVMEHLEGETLAERLRQAGTLDWTAACLIAGQVADALDAAHAKGIVHRDLKPENVFLVDDARDPTATTVKVLDFGVAKLLALDAAARLTMGGMLVGTPEYMSPEQCGGSEEVDHRADIYALGCILFEMLSGQPPFVAATVQELITAHRCSPTPSLATNGSAVPPWLGDLLARMLSKEPGQRPPTMRDVSEKLRQRNAPAPAAALTIAGRAVIAQAADRAPPRETVRPTDDQLADVVGRRGTQWTTAAFALAATVVLTGAILAVRRNSPPVRAVAAPAAVADAVPKATAQLPTAAVTLPKTAPPPRTGASADASPIERRPDRAAARTARRARPAAIQPRKVVDSDGIVDL